MLYLFVFLKLPIVAAVPADLVGRPPGAGLRGERRRRRATGGRIRRRSCRTPRAAARTVRPPSPRRRASAACGFARASRAADCHTCARDHLRPLRRHDPAPRRGGPDRHRPVGRDARPARVGRPAARRLVPRLPQPPRDGDRPARPAAQPDRGGPDRARASRSPSTRASSCSAARSSRSRSPTTSWPGSRASRAIGRLGLIVHATAGFVDPGFRGTLTLEITNLTRVPIKLYAGLPIAQLSFMALDRARRAALRLARARLALPGPGGGHRVALHAVASAPVLHALITFATEAAGEEEPSKTAVLRRGHRARRCSPSSSRRSASAPTSRFPVQPRARARA